MSFQQSSGFPIIFVLNQRNLGEIPNLFKIGIYLRKLPSYQKPITKAVPPMQNLFFSYAKITKNSLNIRDSYWCLRKGSLSIKIFLFCKNPSSKADGHSI